MKKAFTLVELLVVVAIMAMLGTMSVGGYRSMQRGMEDRGAMQNVNQFVRAAYQRAQIDRAPVAVFFWNETSSNDDDDDIQVVHGHAVAVRRAGRISMVSGSTLFDEFGDPADEDADETTSSGSSDTKVFLYRLRGTESSLSDSQSLVEGTKTWKYPSGEILLLSRQSPRFKVPAYQLASGNSVAWQTGDAYGVEFASLDLPNGYIFGTQYSKNRETPIKDAGVVLRFKVGENSGSGAQGGIDGTSSVTVSCLRPNASGEVEAQAVGTSEDPTSSLQN